MITILGPTACGKTHLAVLLAKHIDGEIISADSRQLYRNMDIGTGKDLSEYVVDGKAVPYHLINIADAGLAYNVHEFVKDFESCYENILSRNKKIILCGGSGMYIEAILKGYKLINVPENKSLRIALLKKTDAELISLLKSLKKTHNTSDFTDNERLIRAIEIETYYIENNIKELKSKSYSSLVFGIDMPREIIRQRITERLHYRLNNGMVEEVQTLLDNGISSEMLKYYGLEYKYITLYLEKKLAYNNMVELLNTAIHQFAKRQTTWFRRMEKQGILIHWLDGSKSDTQKLEEIKNIINKSHEN